MEEERTKTAHSHRLRTVLIIVIALVVVLAAAFAASFAINRFSITFSVEDGQTVYAEFGDIYDDSDITATWQGTLYNRQGTALDVTVDGEVDMEKLGTYDLVYTAEYGRMSASITRTVVVEDHEGPVITLVSDPENYTSPYDTYVEEGYTATDNYDGDLTDRVERTEEDGVVTYTVADSFGNVTTVTRTINYKDHIAPVLELTGEEALTVEAGAAYEDPGYTATDDCDGDITDAVVVEGAVDTSTPGTYELTYTSTDAEGNASTLTRTVTVADTTAPKIALNGSNPTYVQMGTTYADAGVTATDACDGDLSRLVTVTNPVDSSKTGIYKVSYSITDAAGNTATATRTVYVYQKQAEVNTIVPDGKVVYLTFDDGPGKYTEKLLDILDKYNVKATFFVTNGYPAYRDMIGEEARRGHTVAIHSYTHNYATVYSSDEAFYDDIEKMNNIIYEQTGSFSSILRFPGGSSNTVSKKYSTGIMTRLTESVGLMGYQYCDWNVSSGDAGDTTSTSKIISNIETGIKKHDVSIVLQHDTHDYSVNAVEQVIVWGLANGYTFLPLDETSPMSHHSVAN